MVVSVANDDIAVARSLIDGLKEGLALLSGVDPVVFVYTDLIVGDSIDGRILPAFERADVGILLLSRAFFRSEYIVTRELPRLRRHAAVIIPVALKPLPLDGTFELQGLNQQVVFMLEVSRGGAREMRAYSEVRAHNRDRFVNELATQVLGRLRQSGTSSAAAPDL